MSTICTDVVAYSGPFARAQLMLFDQYAASPRFMSLIVWRNVGFNLLCVSAPSVKGYEGVKIVMVGIVSREKPYLAPQGTFNHEFKDQQKNARTAKQQITLICPVDDPDFMPDYESGVNNLLEVEGQIATTPRRRFFIDPETRSIRLNFPLWEEKVKENDTPMRNALTNGYTVNDSSTPFFNALKSTHQIRRLPVYDHNEDLVTDVRSFEDKLLGALVEVTFTLRHFYMGPGAGRPEGHDVFTGRMESVSILVKPVPLVRVSETISPKKPRHVPQTPSRSERVGAANAFVPQAPMAQPVFPSAPAAISSGVSAAPSEVDSTSVTPQRTGTRGSGKRKAMETPVGDYGESLESPTKKPSTSS